jgi:spore germination protein GerM
MNAFFNIIINAISNFLSSAARRWVVLVGIFGIVALSEFLFFGLARRTFVFYTIDDGIIVVEDRMLKHSNSKEGDIIRYMEEMLLGPVSPELSPLFPVETRLKSLLYRNGVVYADFSEDAIFPPIEGGSILSNFRTLHTGILRNFSYVKDVRFFIEGNPIYVEEFKYG